jgi:hypothetical protein
MKATIVWQSRNPLLTYAILGHALSCLHTVQPPSGFHPGTHKTYIHISLTGVICKS